MMYTSQNTSWLLIILSIAVISCANDPEAPGGSPASSSPTPVTADIVFEKLLGTWQDRSGRNFERWMKKDDGTYQSDGFSIKGNDTSWNEKAQIYPEGNGWIFDNLVKNQNNGQSIRFASTRLTASFVQFSNPDHDFPTDVCYSIVDDNTLHAFIIGPNDKGGRDTIPFDFVRFKESK